MVRYVLLYAHILLSERGIFILCKNETQHNNIGHKNKPGAVTETLTEIIYSLIDLYMCAF